ncbi:MAG: ketopantoate reductase family protein [Eubacterium sp.]|nr:ketopantoate reductase family protein [Eubacterium sp.]
MKKVSLIGMGALGLLFGSLIYKNCGPEYVDFILDDDRYASYRDRRFFCNDEWIPFRLTRAGEAEPADLLLVCTKATGLEGAIASLKKAVGRDTIIISVLNGITSEQMIGEAYGFEKIVHCVAQAMDAMKFGDKMSYTKAGELRIGIAGSGKPENLKKVEAFFNRAGIAYVEEEDILRRLWSKFMLNVGVNQACMVYGTTYGETIREGSETNRTMMAAMREVIAIGNAEGVDLSEEDIRQYIRIVGTLSADGMPSMAQDRINKRPSEVESFAGTVIRYGGKHHIPVPENEYLYRKIKEIEAGYEG